MRSETVLLLLLICFVLIFSFKTCVFLTSKKRRDYLKTERRELDENNRSNRNHVYSMRALLHTCMEMP